MEKNNGKPSDSKQKKRLKHLGVPEGWDALWGSEIMIFREGNQHPIDFRIAPKSGINRGGMNLGIYNPNYKHYPR